MGVSDPGGAGTAKQQLAVVREVVRSYTYVGIWMSISIAVILFNKWLLAYSGFPFPIALTIWHMAFCSVIGCLAVRVLGLVKSHNMTAREYLTRVMPIGLLYAGSLWLSNSSYLYLSVSFIQMTKSLMPGLVYGCGCLVGTELFRPAVALNMGLIAVGVVVCALGEVNLVLLGLLEQLTALGFEAMRLTLVQVLMNSKGYNMNPLQSLYYVSPACFISLLLPFLCVECPRIMAAQADNSIHFNAPVLLANALAAFALNLAVFLLIGKTSALTMNIAGVIKDWMLIFFSYFIFRAPVTKLNLAGYIFCCSGVVWYNQMKLKALKVKVAQGSSGDKEYSSKSKPEGGLAYLRHQAADLEQPLLQNRNKEDILAEIQRLQAEMEAIDGGVGSHSKLSALGNSSTVLRLHGSSGGNSSNSGGSVSNSPCLSVGSSKLEYRS
ncbi:solute carrier protein [Scenedesmus sp. NREL 46B-D3]|nr:solute carrier protein [Scenedesmus sp. NREL 46B-D3]